MDRLFRLSTLCFLLLGLVPMMVQAKSWKNSANDSSSSASIANDATPWENYNDAMNLFTQKDYKGAEALFEAEIKANPTNSNAYYYRGRCLAELGDNKNAALNYYLSDKILHREWVKRDGDFLMNNLSPEDQSWVKENLLVTARLIPQQKKAAQATKIPPEKSMDDIELGVKGGVVFSEQNYAFNGFYPSNNYLGPIVSVFGVFPAADFLGLQLELNYSRKASSTSANLGYFLSGQISTLTLTATYDYLELPMLIRLQCHLGHDVHGYLLLGPAVSFLLNEVDSYSLTSFGSPPSIGSQNDTAYYPHTAWQFYLGLGVEFGNFLIEARTGQDLTPATGYAGGAPWYNISSNIQIGYRIF